MQKDNAINTAANITLAEEVPTAIEINGISFAVMMLSPHDFENFVHGFLFTEGIVDNIHDIHGIDVKTSKLGVTVECELANRCVQRLQHRVRALKGAGGCGICGTQALEQVFPTLSSVASVNTHISSDKTTIPAKSGHQINHSLHGLRSRLDEFQDKAQLSGAMHAAFWLDDMYRVLYCQEDIGRHNALDKLIGLLRQRETDATTGAILITSRCGAELVHKVVRYGVATLISLASPSALALEMANQYGVRLIHIPKTDQPRIYG